MYFQCCCSKVVLLYINAKQTLNSYFLDEQCIFPPLWLGKYDPEEKRKCRTNRCWCWIRGCRFNTQCSSRCSHFTWACSSFQPWPRLMDELLWQCINLHTSADTQSKSRQTFQNTVFAQNRNSSNTDRDDIKTAHNYRKSTRLMQAEDGTAA